MKSVLTYSGVHVRLVQQHGRAAEHNCIACENPATAWAYQHDCPEELIELQQWRSKGDRRPIPYCMHLEHYAPMCTSCHSKLDNTRGEANGKTIITSDDVIEMRQKYATGKFSAAQLGVLYGMSEEGARNVIVGRTWKHLPVLTTFRRSSAEKLTFQQAEEIRATYAAGGTTYQALAAHYNVTSGTVAHIVRNETYRHPGVGIRDILK